MVIHLNNKYKKLFKIYINNATEDNKIKKKSYYDASLIILKKLKINIFYQWNIGLYKKKLKIYIFLKI